MDKALIYALLGMDTDSTLPSSLHSMVNIGSCAGKYSIRHFAPKPRSAFIRCSFAKHAK